MDDIDGLDKHFNYLSDLDEPSDKCELKCCEIKDNYQNYNGQIKCSVCSNIISNISDNPEWRYYGSKDSKSSDPTRCGMPINTLLPESSVGSTVSFNTGNKTMNQIRKYQQWHGMPYKERSLYKVFLEIQNNCKRHNIPNIIINEAKSLYTIISETKISRGSNRSGIIAACVYFSCKECGVPRSSKEISEIFELTTTVMTKGIKKCQEIIFMNKKNKERLNKSKSIKPDDFIERFCNKLTISEEITKIILEICEISINNNIISENTPPSIASGCIFYYIKKNKGMNITKKDISDSCKISEVTINKCCKKLEANDRLFTEVLYCSKD
jgi:transcription initiation factor TFIIIB Brf1 subunit/transcription initiation factor TFIIB